MSDNLDDNGRKLVEGGMLTLILKFYNRGGALTAPTTASLRIKDPLGAVTTKALADLTQIAPGHYEYNVSLATGGEWHGTLESTGVPAGWNRRWRVEPALVP